MKSSNLFSYKGDKVISNVDKSRIKKLLKKLKRVSPYKKTSQVTKGTRFWTKDKDSNFSCKLRRLKCCAKSKSGGACKRTVVNGLLFCFQHTRSLLHLRIDVSGIVVNNNRMHGLFACDPSKGRNDIVFRKNEEICPYFGEILTKNELNKRYPGDTTAPYALKMSSNRYLDSACFQSIGAKANKAPKGKRNNARFSGSINKPYARLVATTNIRNGQEIFASYGQSYRFTNSGIKPKPKVKKKKSQCGG